MYQIEGKGYKYSYNPYSWGRSSCTHALGLAKIEGQEIAILVHPICHQDFVFSHIEMSKKERIISGNSYLQCERGEVSKP